MPNPEQPVLDAVDALVDEQLTSPNGGTYPKCPHCYRDWHGLPSGRCLGARVEGPMPAPPMPNVTELILAARWLIGDQIARVWGIPLLSIPADPLPEGFQPVGTIDRRDVPFGFHIDDTVPMEMQFPRWQSPPPWGPRFWEFFDEPQERQPQVADAARRAIADPPDPVLIRGWTPDTDKLELDLTPTPADEQRPRALPLPSTAPPMWAIDATRENRRRNRRRR